MDVSIVIPTFNRANLLLELLNSLAGMNPQPKIEWEVIVVDNNSSDGTKDVVHKALINTGLILTYLVEAQQGSSYARNTGARAAQGDIVAFLDDDETVDPHWLSALMVGFEKHSCAGIGGKIIAKWVTPVPDWYTIEEPFKIVGPTAEHNLGDQSRKYTLNDCLPATGNFAVKKDRLHTHGYFRTDMGPVGNDYFMGEDAEFCMRLMSRGEDLIYLPDAIAYNIVHANRLSKAYCRKYHFRFGRMLAQMNGSACRMKTWAYVPRYLFRECTETLLRWATSPICLERRAAFYYELQLDRIAGQIFESIKQGLRWRKR